jgi:hypothetical protein
MELAEYYGGMHNPMYGRPHQMAHILPYGGAFSGGAPSGGAGKKTGRTNRSSAFMNCKRQEYQALKNGWLQGLSPTPPPRWVDFKPSACEKGIRQARLPRQRAVRMTKSGVARKLRKDAGVSKPFPTRVPCDVRGQEMSLPELRQQAKLYRIKGYSKMRKADLCALIDAYSYSQ